MTSSRSMRSLMPRSLVEVVLAERQRRGGTQRRPLVAPDGEEPAPGIGHPADPTLGRCPRCKPPSASVAGGATTRRRTGSSTAVVEQAVTGDPSRPRGDRARPGVRRWTVPRRRARDASERSAAGQCSPAPTSTPAPSPLPGQRRRMQMQRSSVVTRSLLRGTGSSFDVVLGNPPYLSQLAAATTRGGASQHGGGPYADAAVEFLALAVRLARPDGWTRRRRPAAVDPRLARCRSRARGDRPRGRRSRGRGGHLRRSSTPRCSCARSSSSDAGGPRRRRSAVDRHRHRPARCARPCRRCVPPGRSATAPA